MVVLLRRLLIAAVLVLVRDSSVWVWLSLCNFSFAVSHARLWPYARRRDNRAELCLFSLALQTTLLSVWPPSNHSAGLLASLLLCVLIPLAALLASSVPSLQAFASRGADALHVQ